MTGEGLPICDRCRQKTTWATYAPWGRPDMFPASLHVVCRTCCRSGPGFCREVNRLTGHGLTEEEQMQLAIAGWLEGRVQDIPPASMRTFKPLPKD